MPWASHAIGLTRTRWLIARTRVCGRSVRTPIGRQRQLCGTSAVLARAVSGVVGELRAERVQCARDQARDPIGVAAGATSAYERGQPRDALGGVRRATPPAISSTEEAIESRPCTHGPHWRALCSESQRVTRAVSATGQAFSESKAMTPAPSEAP